MCRSVSSELNAVPHLPFGCSCGSTKFYRSIDSGGLVCANVKCPSLPCRRQDLVGVDQLYSITDVHSGEYYLESCSFGKYGPQVQCYTNIDECERVLGDLEAFGRLLAIRIIHLNSMT